ncbi:MAG: hypothetical protein IPI35_09510 [Deltaproteobacteria bacterium]|nr:hypothetical protein [Deltaproteobacteria bacterium]
MDNDAPIVRATTDLLWSLWTELGVNGVVRKHAQVIIDPEALLLFSPLLVASDPRLLELIYSWCVKHHGLIAPSRLLGLRKTLPPEVTGPFDCFAATVRANTPARWTIPKGASPWSTVPALRRVSMDLTRPALRTLRLRAILGVSARADVLGALLSEPGEWVTASQLTPLGYSKRAIALILHDLHEARLIDAQPEKNRITYRLAVGAELGALAGPPASRPLAGSTSSASSPSPTRSSRIKRACPPSGVWRRTSWWSRPAPWPPGSTWRRRQRRPAIPRRLRRRSVGSSTILRAWRAAAHPRSRPQPYDDPPDPPVRVQPR